MIESSQFSTNPSRSLSESSRAKSESSERTDGSYKALYIHIPFCKSKCVYCDFCSEAIEKDDPRIDDYIESLVLELFKQSRAGELADIKTIYIGGGTPSYIGTKSLTSLMYALGLCVNLTDDFEITFEANPDSLDERLVKDMFAMGANRVSIGVQSFNDEKLKMLGRPHTAEDAIKAVASAKERFSNISIDLICGLPHQSKKDFESDLKTAIDLDITHISVYPLTVEEGTQLAKLVHEEGIELPGEDDVADMMELAHDILTNVGFEHYEVSNFAKPGYQSKHNKSYWQGKPYLGLGSDAVSMTQNAGGRIRVKNGQIVDELNSNQTICEDMILAMRTSDGVSVNYVKELDRELFPGIFDRFEELKKQSLVFEDNGRFMPTIKGFLIGNEVYESLLDFF